MRIGSFGSNSNINSPSSTGSLTAALSSNNLNGNSSSNNSYTPNKLKVSRSEMMAYPPGHNSMIDTCLSRMQFHLRKNTQAVVCCFAFMFVLLVITSDTIHDVGRSVGGGGGGLRGSFAASKASKDELLHWGGAVHPGSFRIEDSIIPSTDPNKRMYHFAAVTDLDQKSAVAGAKKPEFQAIFVPGRLVRTTDSFNEKYEISFQDPRQLVTKHNEAGRGAEFSELVVYNNRLLTFDDRTGDVYEIINEPDGTKSKVVPRFVITEGEGDTDKGMKWEWATVKDGLLYIGSMGKEYTRPDGTILNTNNLWIGILNARGELRRESWDRQYTLVRKALGAEAPGYIIMEAILWSDHLHKWVFLPRRISSKAYDENEDESMGGTKLVLVDEGFTKTEVVDIKLKGKDPKRGFSSFAFVPGTQDKHAIAIQSVEDNCTGAMEDCTQRSFFLVFDVTTGDVLSTELEYNEKMKFEGVEFVNLFQHPPK